MTLDGVDGTSTASLRLVNTRAILRLLVSDLQPHTLGALANATGLTRPTVDGALEELVALSLAAEEPPLASRGAGRPARRFRFVAEGGLAAGIDMRADRIRIHVVDLSGRSSARSFENALDLSDARRAVAATSSQLERTLTDAGLDPSLLRAVSVSVPGVVDGSGTLWKSLVVPDWVDANLPEMLRASIASHPIVAVDNAANHAALSEGLAPGDDQTTSMVFILIDEGIGSGVVLGGSLVRGARGGSGEVGALERLRWRRASEILFERTGAKNLDIVFDYARSTGRTREALTDFAHDIAVGTAAMVLAYDPERLVIGGIVGMADDAYLDLIRTRLADLCLYPPTVVRARFGEDAVVRGASMHAVALAQRSLFP